MGAACVGLPPFVVDALSDELVLWFWFETEVALALAVIAAGFAVPVPAWVASSAAALLAALLAAGAFWIRTQAGWVELEDDGWDELVEEARSEATKGEAPADEDEVLSKEAVPVSAEAIDAEQASSFERYSVEMVSLTVSCTLVSTGLIVMGPLVGAGALATTSGLAYVWVAATVLLGLSVATLPLFANAHVALEFDGVRRKKASSNKNRSLAPLAPALCVTVVALALCAAITVALRVTYRRVGWTCQCRRRPWRELKLPLSTTSDFVLVSTQGKLFPLDCCAWCAASKKRDRGNAEVTELDRIPATIPDPPPRYINFDMVENESSSSAASSSRSEDQEGKVDHHLDIDIISVGDNGDDESDSDVSLADPMIDDEDRVLIFDSRTLSGDLRSPDPMPEDPRPRILVDVPAPDASSASFASQPSADKLAESMDL